MCRVWSWLTDWRPQGRTLNQGVKAQSELMARLSHEIRTSLTGIIGYAEFLETGAAEPMMNFTANIIRESGLDLARTSSSYFDLQYLAQSQIRLTCSRVSLAEVTREVMCKHQSKANHRDVSLVFNCSDDGNSQLMNSDIDRLRQVLDALVFDAVQTADKWGCIRVGLSVNEGNKTLVWTLETTASKSSQRLSDLYEKFWHQGNYHFLLQQGPGIELALAKALIQFLGGKVIYRVTLGVPARLVVTFPLSARNLIWGTL